MINLKEVITKYPESLESTSKLRSYLVDLYPEEKARIRVIVDSFDCGVYEKIKAADTADKLLISNLCKKLESDFGYSEKLSIWCLEEWEKTCCTEKDSEEKKSSVPTDGIDTIKNEVISTTHNAAMEAAFAAFITRRLLIGQIVKVTIVSVNSNALIVSLESFNQYIEVPKDELLNELNEENYKPNQNLRLMVIGKNPIRLSEKALARLLEVEVEIEAIKNGKIFECVITSTNKGGLIGEYLSYKVFVPASQIKIGFVQDLEKYVGKTLRLKAEKVESRGPHRQIIGSQRIILEEEKAERDAIKTAKEAELFDNVDEGDVVLGTPVRFMPFGAFVLVNDFSCLVHISELSWTKCNDCAEILEIGKEYEFKVLKIDKDNKKVCLGYKQLQPKPQ